MKGLKVFNISFNKTATSSTHELLKKIGINSVHSTDPALDLAKNFDAINDGHHVNIFKSYYESYPNALFLLNTRPLEDWIVSRYKHGATYYSSKKKSWAWPPNIELTLQWVRERQHHYSDVLNFFKDKTNQLLICNISKSGWQNEIIKFLDINNTINQPVTRNTRNIKTLPDKHIIEIETSMKNFWEKYNYDNKELMFPNFHPSDYSLFRMHL